MKCEEVHMLLIEYLDHVLDISNCNEIEKHLETCERCMDEKNELQSVLTSILDSEFKSPDKSLRENFDSMLQAEIHKIKEKKPNDKIKFNKTLIVNWSSPLLKIAAAIILLISGVLIGMNLKSPMDTEQSMQFSELKKEVKDMKEMMMFTMLKEESPSERIKAVNYADEIPGPNKKVIAALINTLNNDKNVNVRLAAVYSLANFSDNPLVIDSFIELLNKETEPIVQIVLINILTEKKETKAIKPMQKIINNSKTIKEVKDIAEKGIKVLL